MQERPQGLAGLYEDNLFLTYYHEFMDLEPRVLAPSGAGARARGRCAQAYASTPSTSATRPPTGRL